MYYVLSDENGEIWTSPDSKSKYFENFFKENIRLFTDTQPYVFKCNGSVNSVADFLITGYKNLNNFIMSFAKLGGFYRTESCICH